MKEKAVILALVVIFFSCQQRLWAQQGVNDVVRACVDVKNSARSDGHLKFQFRPQNTSGPTTIEVDIAQGDNAEDVAGRILIAFRQNIDTDYYRIGPRIVSQASACIQMIQRRGERFSLNLVVFEGAEGLSVQVQKSL